MVVENLRAAGIVVVASAGNSGPSCSSVSSPSAIFAGTFSVGATSISDAIASFSSRGSVTADGSGRMKPNVTAPGVSVRSAGSGDSYRSLSGTSMAGPHVAGAVGLMISAYPPIAGHVEAIESYLEETADFIGVGDCGGTDEFNNTFGHGRINVNNAVEAIWNIDVEKQVSSTVVFPNQGEDPVLGDLTYTIELTKTGDWITFTNSILSDSLPAGSSFVSSSDVPSQNGDQLMWNIGDMAPGESRMITVSVRLTGTAGTSEDVALPAATISADYVPEQIGSPVTTTVQFENDAGSLFKIERDIPQSFDDDRITQDDTTLRIEYDILVTAPLSIPTVTNTTVTETLPADATLISTTLPVTTTAGGFVWQTATLNAGETVTQTVIIELPLATTPEDIVGGTIFPPTQVESDQTPSLETAPVVLIPYSSYLSVVIES